MTKLAGGGLIAQPRVDTSEAVAVDWRKGTVGHRLGHGRIESAAAAAAYQRSQVAGHMPASAAAAMAAYRRMEGSKMALLQRLSNAEKACDGAREALSSHR